MKPRRSPSVLAPALVVPLICALLIAAPAFAAPTQDAGSPWQLVAQWWDALTAPFASLFAVPAPGGDLSTISDAGRGICDPNGLTAASSCTVEDDPTVTADGRLICDPDG